MLYLLALHADEDGVCAIGVGRLAEMMECGDPVEVRKSLQAAEKVGFVTITRCVSGPNSYQLQRDALQEQQLERLQRAGGSVYQLVDYGLGTRPLNSLLHSIFDTVAALGTEIERYRQLPTEEQRGLHRFLDVDVRNLGVKGGQQVLDAYDAWKAAQPGRVATE